MGRRLKFAIVILVSQLLLIALAIAWVVHMVIIAVNGAAYFVETNPFILWGEIAASVLITLFAVSVFVMQMEASVYQENTEPMLSHINVGTGEDVTIAELAQTIKEVVGFKGELVFNADKPEGTPRKLLDVSRLNNMGWSAKIDLKTGLMAAYNDYLKI